MKKKMLAMVLTTAMCISVLAGCGGQSDTPANGGASGEDSSTKTEKPVDSGKKSGNTIPDEMDFSDVYYLDMGEYLVKDGLKGIKIPILRNAVDKNVWAEGDWKNGGVNSHDFPEFEIHQRYDGNHSGSYYLHVNAMGIDNNSRGGADDKFSFPNDIEAKTSDEKFINTNGRYYHLWYKGQDMRNKYQSTFDYANYYFQIRDTETCDGFSFTVYFVKDTHLFGEDCVSKYGMEYITSIKDAIESLND